MTFKPMIFAAIAAAGLALSAGAADAKTRIHIGTGFGFGYPGYGYGGWCSPMDPFCGGGFYPRHGYHRYPVYRRDRMWDPYRLTCKEAAWKIDNWGYSNVRQVSCGGNFHVLKATKGGKRHTFRANANTGRIVRVR